MHVKELLRQAFKEGYESPLDLCDTIIEGIAKNAADPSEGLFDKIPLAIRRILSYRCIMAGGAVLRLFLGMENKGAWAGDWDIFCNERSFFQIKNHIKWESFSHDKKSSEKYKKKCYEALSENEKINILVANQYSNFKDVVFDFDLSICQIAMDANGLYATRTAWEDIFKRNIRLNPCCLIEDKQKVINRAKKYESRGFSASSVYKQLGVSK